MMIWLILASLFACTDKGSPDDTAGDSPLGSWEHCGEITADETWAAGTHTINCNVDVLGAVLTIEPDATLVFERGDYELRVAPEGSGGLLAEGTEDAPIRMIGGAEGNWHSLGFYAGASPAVLRHVEITDADTEPGLGTLTAGSLVVAGTEVTVEDVTISGGDECGVMMQDDGTFSTDSTGLVVTGGLGWPVCAEVSSLASLPAQDSDYTGNADDRVAIDYIDFTLDQSATWRDLGVPYYVADRLEICGTGALLTLEPGVEVQFAEDGYLAVAPRETCGGGFVASGTAEAPVVLTASGSTETGYWGGVMFNAYADSELRMEYAEVAYGGKDYWLFYRFEGALNFNGVTAELSHVSVHHALCYGLDIAESTVTATDMTYADLGCEDVHEP